MQLNERDKSYIYDMIAYSDEVIDIIKDENHATFIQNRVKRLAVERLIEVIGEAANHVSAEVIKANDDIPWSKIIGLRNKMVRFSLTEYGLLHQRQYLNWLSN